MILLCRLLELGGYLLAAGVILWVLLRDPKPAVSRCPEVAPPIVPAALGEWSYSGCVLPAGHATEWHRDRTGIEWKAKQ